MKKTHKKIFGLLGLILVMAVTTFAAYLPGPGTLAISSVTDKIVVRVLSSSPNVEIIKPKNGDIYVHPIQAINYNYEKVDTGTLILIYTDLNGNTNTYTIGNFTSTGAPESGTTTIDLSGTNYGYGDYVARLVGVNTSNGLSDEDLVSFSYLPLAVDAKDDPATGEAIAELDYDENNADIKKIKLEIYDKNGDLVDVMSPILVGRPNKTAILPFDGNNIPEGLYTIKATALNNNGDPIGIPAYATYDYIIVPIPNTNGPGTTPGTEAPDTGGLFKNLNISRSDYLITGLIVFFATGLGGIYFIIKKSKNDKRR